jgi:hypothetical protein
MAQLHSWQAASTALSPTAACCTRAQVECFEGLAELDLSYNRVSESRISSAA